MDRLADGLERRTLASCERGKPIRLLTLTTLFPNSRQPRHGIFVANRLRRLCDTGRIEAKVVAALPWFPGRYRDTATVPRNEILFGLEVLHPRYLNVPAIGMRLQPNALAHALLGELRRSGIDANDVDAVDAHYFYPDGVAAAQVAEALDLPLVISARGSDINLIGDISFARDRMVRAAIRAQGLIAVSAALAERMTQLGMPSQRLHVLRNGVDTGAFAPFPRAAARRRLGLAEAGRLVLGVGNLVWEKGFDLVIRAVATLPDARLLIVGEGPLRGELSALARSIAEDRVQFLANMPQSELRYAYAAADVMALASTREGWPNVILESLACGTPVVAAAVGGIPEILGPDAPARVVAARSIDAWRDALRDVLDDAIPPERVQRYAFRFGWDEVVTRQCALYEDVVASYQSKSANEAGSLSPCG